MGHYLYHRGENLVFTSDCEVLLGDPTLECLIIDPSELPEIRNLTDYVIRDKKLVRRSALDHSALRVAMISDYRVNCGIATYTKFLCDALRPLVSELRIFAESVLDPDLAQDEQEKVFRCWERNVDYLQILEHLEQYNPDLIFIQHEYGLFHKLAKWNTLMSHLSSRWRTVVVLHTVLEHEGLENIDAQLDYHSRFLAEAACPEVIVHQKRARDTLRSRGYSGRVHYIPHGSPSAKRELPKLPITKYGMFTPHSLFQYGFASSHKGWEMGIEIVSRLKDKYPDIFYLGCMNPSPYAVEGHRKYHHRLLQTIKERGLVENVALLFGYQSELMLENYLRGMRLALFPYQVPHPGWASWGASGAIQVPLSLGIPMVLSDFPAFVEYQNMLPVCSSVERMVEVIDNIFSDPNYERHLSEKSFSVADERSWDKVAQWYLTCSVDRDFDAL